MTDGRSTKPLPYMPLYVPELLAMTVLWTGPEIGLLAVLWVLQWASWPVPLPLDLDQLATAARYRPREFRQLWVRVSTVFDKTPGGWVCRRIEGQYEHAQDLSRKRAEAGSKGGSKPKQRGSSEQAIASDLLKQSGQGSGKEDSPSVPAPPGSKPSVQSLGSQRPTDAQRARGEEDIPRQLTPEIEALIRDARPECDPAVIFRKWLSFNQTPPPRPWPQSLRDFAALERFDEAQHEAVKRRDRERGPAAVLVSSIEQATKRVPA